MFLSYKINNFNYMNIKIRSHYILNICKIVEKELLYRRNIKQKQSLHNIIIISAKNIAHISISHVTEKDIMIDSNMKDIKSYSYEFLYRHNYC